MNVTLRPDEPEEVLFGRDRDMITVTSVTETGSRAVGSTCYTSAEGNVFHGRHYSSLPASAATYVDD